MDATELAASAGPVRKRNLPVRRHFMLLQIDLEVPAAPLNVISAKGLLTTATQNLFGTLGAARYVIDLLSWDEATQQGIAAVEAQHAVRKHFCVFLQPLLLLLRPPHPPVVFCLVYFAPALPGYVLHFSLILIAPVLLVPSGPGAQRPDLVRRAGRPAVPRARAAVFGAPLVPGPQPHAKFLRPHTTHEKTSSPHRPRSTCPLCPLLVIY